MTVNAAQSDVLRRYRLRFLLQEFHLPFGVTIIGRADDCHVTLFDPSVSRRHARIIVDEHRAIIEDLGSLNGCRVNGVRIVGSVDLVEGDRVRIGTQELVFGGAYESSHVQRRQTGSLCYCGGCHTAYAEEMGSCPACGSKAREPPITGEVEDASLPVSR